VSRAVAQSGTYVVLLAIGEPSHYSGEAQSRTQIVVPAAQQALAEAVSATGKPLVVLLRTGRALALTGAVREADAILVTWFLGSQTGPAIADILFGDYNPSARLPVSFPIDPGQQPLYYNHTRTGRPYETGGPETFRTRWRESPHAALYPFGHGLGYARFRYGPPELSATRLAWDDSLTATATITNKGRRAGEEVVQLYVHDRVASRVRPVRELKGFQRVALKPGEHKTVDFTVKANDLGSYDPAMHWIVSSGTYDVWVAPDSASGIQGTFEVQ